MLLIVECHGLNDVILKSLFIDKQTILQMLVSTKLDGFFGPKVYFSHVVI